MFRRSLAALCAALALTLAPAAAEAARPTPAPDPPGQADRQPPSAPGDVPADAADRGANWAVIRWSPASDEPGGSGLRGYAVVAGGQARELGPGATSYELVGLSDDADVLVYAIDNAGNMSDPLSIPVALVPDGAVRATPTPSPTPPAAQEGSVVYACKYPLVGIRYVTLRASIAPPASSPRATEAVDPLAFTADLSFDGLAPFIAGEEAPATFAAEVSGGVIASTTPDNGQPVVATGRVAATAFPGAGPLAATATGSAGPITFDAPGRASLTLDRIVISMRWRYADGTPYILPPLTLDASGEPVQDSDGDPDTFDIYCTQALGGAPYEIGAFDVGDPPPTPTPAPPRTYALQGTATLPAIAKGPLPLTGGLSGVRFDPSTGALTTGVLTFNDTQARLLLAAGGLPVTATIGFIPSGSPTGSLDAGTLLVVNRVRIKVKSIKAFGAIPLAGGNNCQTKQLAVLELESTDPFVPTAGGTLATGEYAISDLNGCEPFGSAVNPKTASVTNTVTLKAALRP